MRIRQSLSFASTIHSRASTHLTGETTDLRKEGLVPEGLERYAFQKMYFLELYFLNEIIAKNNVTKRRGEGAALKPDPDCLLV